MNRQMAFTVVNLPNFQKKVDILIFCGGFLVYSYAKKNIITINLYSTTNASICGCIHAERSFGERAILPCHRRAPAWEEAAFWYQMPSARRPLHR